MKVKHITLRQYVEGVDRKEVDFILQYGQIEPLDLYKIGDLVNRSFGFVKDIQDIMNYSSGLTWERYINFLTSKLGIDQMAIYNESIYKLQASRLYLKNEVDGINEIERIGLSHSATAEEEAADLTRFEKYRSFPQFDKLMTLWPQYNLDEVRALDYLICFTKLKWEADKAEYEKDYNRILKLKKP